MAVELQLPVMLPTLSCHVRFRPSDFNLEPTLMFEDRGQGLNNAIKDASDIVDSIKAAVAGTQSLAHGITAYDDEMRARGTREVELSFQQMQMSERKAMKDSPMFKIGHGRNDATKTPAANGV